MCCQKKTPADEQNGGFYVQRSLYSCLLYYGTLYYMTFILIGTTVYRNFLSTIALMNKQSALLWPNIQDKSEEAYPDPDASLMQATACDFDIC